MKKLLHSSGLAMAALVFVSFAFFGLVSRSNAQSLQPEEIMYLIDLVLKADPATVPVPESVSQDELVMKMMTMFDAARRGTADGVIEMISDSADPTAVPQPEPTAVSDEPIDCFLPKARVFQKNFCTTNGVPTEFAINIEWQPRLMTHIAGIGAMGVFVEMRVSVTNMTDKTWDGFKASSFSVMENLAGADARMTFALHEAATTRKSKSYEVNQLNDPVFPGQTVTYFLVFDIPKDHGAQSLIFRAVDYSDQKSETRIRLPLPDYIPVEYKK